MREEGPEIVRAARVNNRVCQVGMQQRSGDVYLEARERYVRSGLLGKISHVDCVWHGGANQALPTEPAQKPANLDWVRFLGALKYRDWNPAQYLDFRAFLDFGGGKLTDFGAHWLDVVHMFMPCLTTRLFRQWRPAAFTTIFTTGAPRPTPSARYSSIRAASP